MRCTNLEIKVLIKRSAEKPKTNILIIYKSFYQNIKTTIEFSSNIK